MNGKILLIDDNESTNMYHKIMIEEAGLDLGLVSEFTSSSEAMDYLASLVNSNQLDEFPNVILVDINMPQKNGWDCVEMISDWNLGNHNPKIYMVSNSRHPKDIDRAKNHPLINELLEKFVDSKFFTSLFN